MISDMILLWSTIYDHHFLLLLKDNYSIIVFNTTVVVTMATIFIFNSIAMEIKIIFIGYSIAGQRRRGSSSSVVVAGSHHSHLAAAAAIVDAAAGRNSQVGCWNAL
jgi:hypothetical protein